MIWSGGFSIVGWLLVGIPIAALRPLFRSRWQAILMIPVSGFIGLLLPFIVFRTWDIFSINPMSMFVLFTAAVAMMIYLLLTWRQHNGRWLRHTSTSKRTAGALRLTGEDSSEEQLS